MERCKYSIVPARLTLDRLYHEYESQSTNYTFVFFNVKAAGSLLEDLVAAGTEGAELLSWC